jgi:hypothetical protein
MFTNVYDNDSRDSLIQNGHNQKKLHLTHTPIKYPHFLMEILDV